MNLYESIKKNLKSLNESQKLNEAGDQYKQKFIDYCKGKIKDLGSVDIKGEDVIGYTFLDDEDEDKIFTIRIDCDFGGNYKALDGEDTFNAFELENSYLSNGKFVDGGQMDAGLLWHLAEMNFKYIDTDFYKELLDNWENWEMSMRLEEVELDNESRLNESEELKEVPSYESFRSQILNDLEMYYEDLMYDDDDVFGGTEDSYANEMVVQHLFDTLYYNIKQNYDSKDAAMNTANDLVYYILDFVDHGEEITLQNDKVIKEIYDKYVLNKQEENINESEKLKESSNLIWTSETTEDDYDKEDLKANQYQDYLDNFDGTIKPDSYEDWLESDWLYNYLYYEFNNEDNEYHEWYDFINSYDEEDLKRYYQDYLDDIKEREPNKPKEFEEWFNDYVIDDADDQWRFKEEDLKDNVLPMIDKQVNGAIFITGNYNSNYPEFRKSGPGGKIVKDGDDLIDWLSEEDRVDFTNETGNQIGVSAYDHDGSIGGLLFTLPDDQHKILEIALSTDYYDKADYEDNNEIIEEFMYDLSNGNVSMHDVKKPELLVPIKNGFLTTESESLKESSYTLEPKYDSAQSFYGKARVEQDGDAYTLISYTTPILTVRDGNIEVLCDEWAFSQTTLRHVREFLRQMEDDGKVDLSSKDPKLSTKKWLLSLK